MKSPSGRKWYTSMTFVLNSSVYKDLWSCDVQLVGSVFTTAIMSYVPCVTMDKPPLFCRCFSSAAVLTGCTKAKSQCRETFQLFKEGEHAVLRGWTVRYWWTPLCATRSGLIILVDTMKNLNTCGMAVRDEWVRRKLVSIFIFCYFHTVWVLVLCADRFHDMIVMIDNVLFLLCCSNGCSRYITILYTVRQKIIAPFFVLQ